MKPLSDSSPLQSLFAGITEHTFLSELGMADPGVIDYLSTMLLRFVHRDAIYAVKSPRGKRLEELAEMMVEAERPSRKADQRREIFRHMGDFALFWTGVYPETLDAPGADCRMDSLISYFEQGKRSYYIASTYSDVPYEEEAPVLRRLSEEFELCAYGLRQVRHQWEQAQADA